MKRRMGCESGSSSVEFVILFPIYMVIFMSAFELGVHMVRQVMLDRATDLAVRSLRLGTFDNPSHASLRTEICNQTAGMPKCEENLAIELTPIDQATWSLPGSSPTCIDKTQNLAPPTIDDIGEANQMMLIRVCALVEPFFPTTGLALAFEKVDGTNYIMIAKSAFVNEPGA